MWRRSVRSTGLVSAGYGESSTTQSVDKVNLHRWYIRRSIRPLARPWTSNAKPMGAPQGRGRDTEDPECCARRGEEMVCLGF